MADRPEYSAAVDSAREIAEKLKKSPVWYAALTNAAPDEAALNIQRLDHADESYLIVTFRSGGRLTARFALDGRTRALQEANGIKTSTGQLREYIATTSAEGIARSFLRQPDDARPISTTLVWKPCLQSTSPLRPFWKVQFGMSEAYVRIDADPSDRSPQPKHVFTELSTERKEPNPMASKYSATADDIVREIVDAITTSIQNGGKTLTPGALDEWAPKLTNAVAKNLSLGGDWNKDRAKVMIVATDMATIAIILSYEQPSVTKSEIHAAFRAVRFHRACPGPGGQGAWCNFD